MTMAMRVTMTMRMTTTTTDLKRRVCVCVFFGSRAAMNLLRLSPAGMTMAMTITMTTTMVLRMTTRKEENVLAAQKPARNNVPTPLQGRSGARCSHCS